MSGSTFERHEIKYMLDSRQRRALEEAMADHMVADQYGESTICSLYYDTPDSRLIRRSLEKPKYKEKLRVRSYGTAKPDGTVYVELKKKVKGVVYKRRIPMTDREAKAFLAGGEAPAAPAENAFQFGQIAKELAWTRDYYKTLRPAMYLCYDRIAYFCPEDAGLRITFDRKIRWRDYDLSLTIPPSGDFLLRPDQSLLEIKTGTALPLWLVKALNDIGIHQASFSKYGTAYTITQLQMIEGGNLSA